MKKEDAIKFLQQLYPNGGHCWLDKQRIEAIGMAIKALQEEPVSDVDFEQELYKAFGQVKDFTLGMRIAKWFYDMGKNNQEHACEDLEQAAEEYMLQEDTYNSYVEYQIIDAFNAGAKWQKEQMMKDAIPAYIRRNRYTKENVLNGFSVTCEPIQKFKDKDKVKVIIIKEED